LSRDGEQFVAYFLPTNDTLQKKRRDEESQIDYDADDEYDFKLTREYTWNIKPKNEGAYEENYFFIMRDDGVFYNELESKLL
jgi:RNA polymerase II-associated factor 1